MTTTLPALHQVGDRVHVHPKGQLIPGDIASVHRSDRGVEYVMRTQPADGGHDSVVNIWTTSGHSSPHHPGPGPPSDRRRRPGLASTPLSRRLGVTRTARDREQILTAHVDMDWSADIDTCLAHLDGEAARAVVAAVYHHRRDQLRLVGIAALPDGHQLVGLQEADGTRSYLLDLDAEAIHVLIALPTVIPTADHPTASHWVA